jgi:hypothetical protein
MASRAEMEAEAERRIWAQIQKHYPPIFERLATLQPLEAYALLGNLAVDTIARFPPAGRLQLAKAWTTTFLEGVQDGMPAKVIP